MSFKKWRIMLFLIVASCLFCLLCRDYASADLVAHYKMNEGEGATVHDSSAYGNDGSIWNSAPWATGDYGTAIYMDGSSGHCIGCGHDSSLCIEDSGSLFVWFVPDTDTECNGGLLCWGSGAPGRTSGLSR